jgi:hypothetical protein
MKKIIGTIAIVGVVIYIYNQYKKSKLGTVKIK